MELIEIAQLVTGIATLIVASVLIWQMFIQKRTLDIAHNDADTSLSFDAVEQKNEINMWFTDKIDQQFLDHANKGLSELNDVEREILANWLRSSLIILITEYRLGRMDRNYEYFINNIKRLLRFKASQEYIKDSVFYKPNSVVKIGLTKIINEAYEEVVGEKLPG
tara:strand:- start:297 stop:791 length:495 start_codon:yes stop_codon:yes gene_type:complete